MMPWPPATLIEPALAALPFGALLACVITQNWTPHPYAPLDRFAKRVWWSPGVATAMTSAVLVVLHDSMEARAVVMAAHVVSVVSLCFPPSRERHRVGRYRGKRSRPRDDAWDRLRTLAAVTSLGLQFLALAVAEGTR